jgi:hypothetical protein
MVAFGRGRINHCMAFVLYTLPTTLLTNSIMISASGYVKKPLCDVDTCRVSRNGDNLQCRIPRALAFSEDRRHANFGQSPTSHICQQWF